MIKPLLAAATIALFAATGAYAQDKKPERKVTAQQQRMSACNKEAREKKLKGDARKKFMGECLKAKKPS